MSVQEGRYTCSILFHMYGYEKDRLNEAKIRKVLDPIFEKLGNPLYDVSEPKNENDREKTVSFCLTLETNGEWKQEKERFGDFPKARSYSCSTGKELEADFKRLLDKSRPPFEMNMESCEIDEYETEM